MIIYGAGMAGLLAGHMLRRYEPVICEAQPELPHNHSAVLRFRSLAVSEATHIPFREVIVHKAVMWEAELCNHATLAMQNMYSNKVVGIIRNRSIINTESAVRYIAPPDFIAQLAKGLDIHYATPLLASDIKYNEEPAISTIPMKLMMRMVGVEHDKRMFRHSPIWTLNAELAGDINVYQTIYYPENDYQWYRASITGNWLTVEFIDQPEENLANQYIEFILSHFGLARMLLKGPAKWKRQEYGKLIPIADHLRHHFIDSLTEQFNIYSLGRFGTWRQILLDDIVNDVRVIDQLITIQSRYMRSLARLQREQETEDNE